MSVFIPNAGHTRIFLHHFKNEPEKALKHFSRCKCFAVEFILLVIKQKTIPKKIQIILEQIFLWKWELNLITLYVTTRSSFPHLFIGFWKFLENSQGKTYDGVLFLITFETHLTVSSYIFLPRYWEPSAVKPLYSGHHRDLKLVPNIERCPLHRDSF